MTALKLHYCRLNPKEKNEFRDKVINNEIGIKVSLSSFFNYLENQHAPVPLQVVLAKLTGIKRDELYHAA